MARLLLRHKILQPMGFQCFFQRDIIFDHSRILRSWRLVGKWWRRTGASLDISNVIAALSEDQVERITGLTKRQLRYWAKTGFFKPSFVEDNPRLPYSRFYSFKDLVGLRTLKMLRGQNAVPLQHLRVVAEKLSHLGDDLWSSTTLFVVNRKVVLINPKTGTPEEVVSSQYLLGIPLRKNY